MRLEDSTLRSPANLFSLIDAELDLGVKIVVRSVWDEGAYRSRSATILEEASGSLQEPALGYATASLVSTAITGAIFAHDSVPIVRGSTAAPAESGWQDLDQLFNEDAEILLAKKFGRTVAFLTSETVKNFEVGTYSSEDSLKRTANYFKSLQRHDI